MSLYKQLLAEQQALDQKIAAVRKAESATALAQIQEQIALYGFTAQEVFPWKHPKPPVPAKFYDPSSGAIWSGRGRTPKWMAGKDREHFAIRQESSDQRPET